MFEDKYASWTVSLNTFYIHVIESNIFKQKLLKKIKR